MNFGEALALLKTGEKLTRGGWNGAGQYIYYIPAGVYPPSTRVAENEFGKLGVPYTAYLAIKTVQRTVAPWIASQTDMLAEDWEIVK